MLSLVGVGLVTRAAVNLPARRLITLAGARRPITVEKTLLVGAPADRVWELWSNFEGFPQFMAHLREVRKIEEGRSHWVAVGPAGVPAEWEAIITDWVPGQFIGWRSVENSPIETSGQVRLSPVSDRETQIDVQLTYTPPAGPPDRCWPRCSGPTRSEPWTRISCGSSLCWKTSKPVQGRKPSVCRRRWREAERQPGERRKRPPGRSKQTH